MIPSKPGSGLHETLKRNGTDIPVHPFWVEASERSTHEDDLHRKREYKIPPELVDSLRTSAKKFEGNHNFHNFTVGRDFSDRSCQRYVKSVEVGDCFASGQIVSLHHAKDCGSHGIRRYRVDKCPFPRAELHAAPGMLRFFNVRYVFTVSFW